MDEWIDGKANLYRYKENGVREADAGLVQGCIDALPKAPEYGALQTLRVVRLFATRRSGDVGLQIRKKIHDALRRQRLKEAFGHE